MVLVLLTWMTLATADAISVGIAGDLHLELHYKDAQGRRQSELLAKSFKPDEKECFQTYPDSKHINALLGNMMNKLTKIYVRSHEFIVSQQARRREHDRRFTVITKKDQNFFNNIYTGMSKDFWRTINQTSQESKRKNAKIDPCDNEKSLKELWRSVIDTSLAYFRKASVKTIEQFLQKTNRANDARTKNKLGQFVLRELKNARKSQMNQLCQNFQMCSLESEDNN